MLFQVILQVAILLGALIVLGLLLLKKAGKRGCAACGNRGCPMNPGYEGEKRNTGSASRLPGLDENPGKAGMTKSGSRWFKHGAG
jgi:hypothetical protein